MFSAMTRLSALLALALLFCSCASPRFERDWKQAVQDYEQNGAATPTGPWTGSWTTSTNGHTGDLRCIVSEDKTTPGNYEFRYHATWAGFLQGAYAVNYPARKIGANRYSVKGDQDLGMFGKFTHKGTISDQQFKATYSSERNEVGAFEMSRPE